VPIEEGVQDRIDKYKNGGAGKANLLDSINVNAESRTKKDKLVAQRLTAKIAMHRSGREGTASALTSATLSLFCGLHVILL